MILIKGVNFLNNYLTYITLILLICLSAFFSATETAYSTVNKFKVKQQSEKNNKKAKLAYDLIENFDKTLTSTLIGNNLINIAASSIATVLAVQIWGNSGAAIATFIMTIIILTFGEIIPKCTVKENSEAYVINTSYVIKIISICFSPFTFLFLKIKGLVGYFSKSKSNANEPDITENDLKFIVENIEEEGVLEKQESELVQSALVFDEKTVQEILTPRVDVIGVDLSEPYEYNCKQILGTRFSRLPVYKGDIDNIVGILYTKDFMLKKLNNIDISIESLVVPAYFIYKTNKLSNLLNEFQKHKIQIAIVTDDYGGTLGIVTLEDLLEQLVGDIWDEDELIDPDCLKIKENKYNISGDMPIRDMFEILELNINEMDYEHKTMGGWALEKFSHIPSVGESFKDNNLIVTVKQMDDQRIKRMILQVEQNDEKNNKEGKINE